jgi:hypothetical protein
MTGGTARRYHNNVVIAAASASDTGPSCDQNICRANGVVIGAPAADLQVTLRRGRPVELRPAEARPKTLTWHKGCFHILAGFHLL